MKKCLKCGYERQAKDGIFAPATECPQCGIVYAKYDNNSRSQLTTSLAATANIKKPSPVHESTLKKARERLEKRLRQQMEGQLWDKRHSETLERARQITSAEMNKRRAERELTQQRKSKTNDQHPKSTECVNPPAESNSISTLQDQALDTPASKSINSPIKTEKKQERQETKEEREKLTPLTDTSDTTMETEAEKTNIPKRKPQTIQAPIQKSGKSGRSLMTFMPIVAWIILCAGIAGAILSWITMDDVQAGIQTNLVNHHNSFPLGLLLSFAYLAIGMLGFAFFWMASMINNQLKQIHQLMLTPALQEVEMEESNLALPESENNK